MVYVPLIVAINPLFPTDALITPDAVSIHAVQPKIGTIADVKKVSIEMATTFGWAEWTGSDGLNIGIDRFGISGKGDQVQAELGFSPEAIVDQINNKFYK